MLTAIGLDGSIMDMANKALVNLTAQSGASSPTAPTPGSAPASSAILPDLLDLAKKRAEADKRKATWLLVGVGVGSLVGGVLLGRYVVPAKKRRK